jgi:hypothetical protein
VNVVFTALTIDDTAGELFLAGFEIEAEQLSQLAMEEVHVGAG